MTVALFLQLCQILAALGGAGVAFETIKADIKSRKLRPQDPLPPEHEATVRAALAPAQSTSTAADFIATLGR